MRILLAEDDTNISMIAKVALEKVGGHEVVAVLDGGQAIAQIESSDFDLILLDGMMPVKDGLTVCREVKTGAKKNIPIIFLSAKSQDSDISEGLNAGAIGYIQKPFDPTKLSEEIDKILNESGVAA